MAKDKNEIVPIDDDSINSRIEIKDSEKVEKYVRDFFKKNPNGWIPVLAPKGENTQSLKLDYILNLLWTINERLDKIDSKLSDLESEIDDIYDRADELYEAYLCDE